MGFERADEWHEVPRHHTPRFYLPPETGVQRSRVIDYSSPTGLRRSSPSAVTWRDVGFCTVSICAISFGLLACSIACWYLFQILFRHDTFDGDLLVMIFLLVGLLAWPAVLRWTLGAIRGACLKRSSRYTRGGV